MATLLNRPFILAFSSNLLMGITFALFIQFAGFLQQLGADGTEIGLVVGIGSVGSLVVRPYVGRLMDRIGRLPLIHAGNVINVVSLGLYLTVTEISWWVYALTVAHGIAEAILYTALTTYGADLVPADRRTEGLALFGVSGQLPIAIGGLAGDLILRVGSYRTLFAVAAALGLAALGAAIPLGEISRASGEPSRGFLHAVRQRPLWPLWMVTAVFAVAVVSFFTFLKTYVLDTGLGSVGSFFALYSLTAITLRILGKRLPARVGELRLLVAALASLAAGLAMLAAATGDTAVAVAGVLCGAGHGYAFPILYSLVVTRSAEADRGSALSGFLSFFPLAGLAGAPVLGAIIDRAGYSVMFGSVGVVVLAVAAAFALWQRAVAMARRAAVAR